MTDSGAGGVTAWYREEKRVQDMVIAIDTSASVSGNTVKNFIRRTFEMLRAGEQYSERVCIHIIQCDSEIQSDTVISDLGRLEAYLEGFSLRGFGGTDFRPVFKYVQQLIDNKNLKDMKGLVYLTDGYGIYPAKKPPYEVLFAFLDDDEYRPPVPLWAMKAVVKDTV